MNVNDPYVNDPYVNAPYCERTHALGCGSLVLRLLMPLLAALVLTATSVPAHADGCTNCRMPSLTDLEKEPGFVLLNRPAGGGHIRRDHYLIDRGECVTASSGTPTVTRGHSWLALRGMGEVWNCPHSRSEEHDHGRV